MLFRQDLFHLDWEPKQTEVSITGTSIRDAIDMGLEFAKMEEWAAALGLIEDAVSAILLQARPNKNQQTLLALAAICKARLAANDGRWSAAADWLWTSMSRCEQKYEPDLGIEMAYEYLLMCAAMAAGIRVFSYEPSQLHVHLDEEAFRNLSLAYVRLSALDSSRQEQALLGIPTLRQRIQDQLWQDSEFAKTRRRGETNINEITYQRTTVLLNDVYNQAQQILELPTCAPVLRERATQLIQTLARGRNYLLSEELSSFDQLKTVLGRELTVLTQSQESVNPLERRANIDQFTTQAAYAIGRLSQGGIFAHSACLPIVQHLSELALREMEFAESDAKPIVLIKQAIKRYPLDQVSETIRFQVELVNQGRGLAQQCQVQFEAPEGNNLSFVKQMPLLVGAIGPGRSVSVECPLRLVQPVDTLVIAVSLSYSDAFGTRFQNTDQLVVERQRSEPDWDDLIFSAPYRLEPVDTQERLRGRKALLDEVKVNTAIGTSTVLWGQKRVGKTSIAKVFYRDVVNRKRHLPIYIRRGDIAAYSEGQIAHALAQRIVSEAPDLKLEVPDETWFGPHLTRLTDWLSKARQSGLDKGIVIIIDEFDEINSGIYLGQRGSNFFATLRSLSEQGVVWVFVGSERMHEIYLRHHATLNKVAVNRVDRVTDPRDIEDMIVNPVQSMLDWDQDAVDLVRQLSAGNPYFVHLLCQRVLKEMYHTRRTFIDRADVTVAAEAITDEDSPTHWGHFWEDNAAIEPDMRAQQAAHSALILAAFGTTGGTTVSLPVIESALKNFDYDDLTTTQIAETLTALSQRGVLQSVLLGSETRYQVVVPLFGDFLLKHGRTVVAPFYKHYKSTVQSTPMMTAPMLVSTFQADTFPIDEDELISISEGLTYLGTKIDAVRVKAWLRQFPDEGAILIAAKVLRRLKERYFFDLPHIRHAIDDAYKLVVDQIKETGGEAILVAPTTTVPGRVINIHLSYLGGPQKSGAETMREFKNQKRIARGAALDDAIKWVLTGPGVKQEQKFLLIVDSFVGSGTQATKELLGLMNKLRRQPELIPWAEQGHILFIPLWAYVDGIDHIKQDVGDLVRVQAARLLGDEDRAFARENDLFAGEHERRYAEEIFTQIGEQLQRDYPLGYGACQSLVVFENTVPNNTLPVLWSSGVVDEKPWRSLFWRP